MKSFEEFLSEGQPTTKPLGKSIKDKKDEGDGAKNKAHKEGTKKQTPPQSQGTGPEGEAKQPEYDTEMKNGEPVIKTSKG